MELIQLPKSLNDVTLEQWVGWNNTYGKELMAKLKDSQDDEDKMLLFESEFALKHYAYYSNTPTADIDALLAEDMPDTVRNLLVEVIKESGLSQAMMFREMSDIPNTDFKNAVFKFDGRDWKIVPPVSIDAATKLSVAEFEKCQDIALIMSDLQDGRYEAMYELCVMYLKAEDGAIISNPKPLPLYIALCVKAYIVQTINLFNQLSHDGATTSA